MRGQQLYTPFSVQSTDNVTLAVKYWGEKSTSSTPVLVFVHQYAQMGGEGSLMEGMAAEALSRGMEAVTFDLRGAGASSGNATLTNFNELDDVKAVVDWVALRDRDVFLIGSSGE